MFVFWKVPACAVLVARAVAVSAFLGAAVFCMASLIAYLAPVACGAVLGEGGRLLGIVYRFVFLWL